MEDTPPTEEPIEPQRSIKWSWFIDECSDDFERRRGIYSYGEAVRCKEICGVPKHFADKKKSKYENFANICLFLPHPLPEAVGPLDHYVTKVRSILLGKKAFPEGQWIGFDAGPFPLPYHPWSLNLESPDTPPEGRDYDLQSRVDELYERMERPNRHFERRLQNYFSGSGIEPALTLAITSYLSNFCLSKLDVFHLYTAVLFSGELLNKFEKRFSQINQAIKDDIINHLQTTIARKEALSVPHPFESQSLELIQSRAIEEIFLYVYQYGNYSDLRCFIDEEIDSGPHFFFKFIWKGIPFNKLFLGFLKLKPTDQLTFACDILLNKDPTYEVPTNYFSELHMGGIVSYKQPEFFKEHFPIRRGYRFDNSLIEGKVLTFKSSLGLPNRELNWEEEILLACSTPNNLKSKMVKDWCDYVEFQQINMIEEVDEMEKQQVPNERREVWGGHNSNTKKQSKKVESVNEAIEPVRKIDLNEVCSSSSDLFHYTSFPLDDYSKLRQPSLLSISSSDFLEDIEVRRDVEDLITAEDKLLDLDKNDFITEEVYSGDIFESEEDFIEGSRDALLNWTERNLMTAEEMRSELSFWNPLWEFNPYTETSGEWTDSIYEDDECSDEELPVKVEQVEPTVSKKEKNSLENKELTGKRKEPPYWLRTMWKKVMWINWRGRNRLWIMDTLNKIEYLLLRKSLLKNISYELEKYHHEQSDDSDQELETSSNSSVVSEEASSSGSLVLRTLSSVIDTIAPEPGEESIQYSSSFSSISVTDCKYIVSTFCAQSHWEFNSTPPASRHLEKSVAFFEMCARVLRQKEEILHHALGKNALYIVPHKLNLCRQIQRVIMLFLNYEMSISSRISKPPSSSLTSVVSHKSTRSKFTGAGFRLSAKRSYVSRNYKDLGDWFSYFDTQVRQSNVLTRTRLLAYLRSLENFKRVILDKFLSEVSALGEISDSLRWKLSIKRPIRCQGAFLNFCCRIGPIRNTTFLCDLLSQSKSLKAFIMSKIEAMMMHHRIRKKHQTSIRTAGSSFVAVDDSDSDSFSQTENILFHEEDIIKKWPRKKEWPSQEDDNEYLQGHWLDKNLFEIWKSSYSPQNMLRRIIILLGLRHLKHMKITAAHRRIHKQYIWC